MPSPESKFSTRLAELSDIAAIKNLMTNSIDELQKPFLSNRQIEASHEFMGMDTQLVLDQTYFIVEFDDILVGCGGWSKRNTLFGGDHAQDHRNSALLDPSTEAARVRAMFTHPCYARRGVGRKILELCEAAARSNGFAALELMATKSGEPLYASYGFHVVEHTSVTANGIDIPLARMAKSIL